MKLLCKNPIAALLAVFVLLAGIGLVGSLPAQAATLPVLGTAGSYSILAQTGITGTGTISGDVENNGTGAAITGLTTAMVGGTIYSSDGVATLGAPPAPTTLLNASVQADALAAFTTGIPAQVSDGPIVGDLNGQTFTPGVYDQGAITLSGGSVTLDGAGVYIFRSASSLITSGSINFINGARACDLFWRVETLATINGTSFAGTILSGTGVHFGANVALDGRALAIGGDVTLLDNTISGPTCAVATGNINVTKVVVGGSSVIADFPLFVNGGVVVSGATNPFAPGVYTITETGNANYTAAYSGDCVGGTVTLLAGANNFCIVTNTYAAPLGGQSAIVPPLIDVVKVPNPLALPAGPGSVVYTYTVTNPGTVALNNVSLVGDTCSPIALISGDLNSDAQLQSDETWVYTCTSTLTETHTNNVVAYGSANGITATDIASATVIVGIPDVVPPLIHITKVPSPLALSNGGGLVTYTKKVTNPGTVPLTNVTVTDDKCSPLVYISGDSNSDSRLDPSETWTYTCSANLTQTTTNTATATGQANGLTARDFAIVTVVVTAPVPPTPVPPVPALPDTGFAPQGIMTFIVLLGMLISASVALYIYRKKLTN